MLHEGQVEELICLISALDKPTLIRQIHTYRANFPVDFTPEFLQTCSVERLRHIFLAMCLQCQRLPEVPLATPTAA